MSNQYMKEFFFVAALVATAFAIARGLGALFMGAELREKSDLVHFFLFAIYAACAWVGYCIAKP
jgi:hypothetical protein